MECEISCTPNGTMSLVQLISLMMQLSHYAALLIQYSGTVY